MISLLDIAIIIELIIIEGLLSFDNALALAAMVKNRLPSPQDQRRALLWGIWGSYIFRTAIIFVGVWIIQNQWIKLIAGLYLIWLAISELFLKHLIKEKQPKTIQIKSFLTPLWSTIISVELMDVMFSIDSIGVALALSKKIWVLISGAIIGIFMMRMAAQFFVKLITIFPLLIKTAFVLVGLAGLNIVLDIQNMTIPLINYTFSIDSAIPEKMFLFIMLTITFGSIVLNYFQNKTKQNKT